MNGKRRAVSIAVAGLAAAGFVVTASAITIEKTPFGTVTGIPVDLFTMTNDNGIVLKVTTYGGIVTSLVVPDKNGLPGDIVLGFNTLGGYTAGVMKKANSRLGAITGTCGNRPGDAGGFATRVWEAKVVPGRYVGGVALRCVGRAVQDGVPGNLTADVICLLTDKNELRIEYAVATDTATACTLAHNLFFNLGGEGSGDILGTCVILNAGKFIPLGSAPCAAGAVKNVAGTPFDFRTPMPIGARISDDDPQLHYGNGYDHTWIIDRRNGTGLTLAATAFDHVSGRAVDVLTTETGIALSSGNFLDGTLTGKSGKPYSRRGGFCLEPGHGPDFPDKPGRRGVVLKPGRIYKSTTVYKLYTRGGQ